MKRKILSLLSLLALASQTTTRAGVLPPDTVVGDKSIAEWTAEWWKWVYSIPPDQHPLFDVNGDWATNGQPEGPVFFLAGVFVESGTARRSFTVSEGKFLFFPLVNVAPDNIDVAPPPLTVDQLREHATASIDLVTGLHASINLVEVPNLFDYRLSSPVFSVFFDTANNLPTFFVGHPVVGLVDPIVSEGYWLMVEPLPPGTHVINFGATVGPPVNFTLDITDTITVVPDANKYVLPPDAIVGDKTISEWSAEWWKWIFPAPTNQNPLLETNGAWAHAGQPDGEVFFIAGVSGLSPDRVTRTFTVPEGKYLFFPLMPLEVDNINTVPPLSIEELRAQAEGFISNPRELHASIDGVAITNLLAHRAISPVFNVFYTSADNFATFNYGIPITGLMDPMLSDGYWLMVKPLPPGPHVINFGSTFANPFWFPVDITAKITVVPTPLEQKVEELLAKVETANIPAKRKRVLEMTLLRAGAAFEKGKLRAGIVFLRVFQHQVRAHLFRSSPDLAQDLVSDARAIIDRARQDLDKKHRGDDDDEDEHDEKDDDRDDGDDD